MRSESLGYSKWCIFTLWKHRLALSSFRCDRSLPFSSSKFFIQGCGALLEFLKMLARHNTAVVPSEDQLFTGSMGWNLFYNGGVLRKVALFSLLPEWKLLLLHTSTWKVKCSWVSSFSYLTTPKAKRILEYLMCILLLVSVWYTRIRSINLGVSKYLNLLFK